jgi:hypothetical protein
MGESGWVWFIAVTIRTVIVGMDPGRRKVGVMIESGSWVVERSLLISMVVSVAESLSLCSFLFLDDVLTGVEPCTANSIRVTLRARSQEMRSWMEEANWRTTVSVRLIFLSWSRINVRCCEMMPVSPVSVATIACYMWTAMASTCWLILPTWCSSLDILWFKASSAALRRFSNSVKLDFTVFEMRSSVIALMAVAGDVAREFDSWAVVAVLLYVLSEGGSFGNWVVLKE